MPGRPFAATQSVPSSTSTFSFTTTGPSTPAGRYEDAGGYGGQDARVADGAVLTEIVAARGRLPQEKHSGREDSAGAGEPLVHTRVVGACKKRRMTRTLLIDVD